MPRFVRRRLRFGKRGKLFRSRRLVYRRRKTYFRRRRAYRSRRRSSRIGRRFANTYTKVNAVIPVASLTVYMDAAFGQFNVSAIQTTMTNIIGASQAVAGLYGGFQYYRIRRGYVKLSPKITNWVGPVPDFGAAPFPGIKPRLFSVPYTTSFDSVPTNFNALLEYGGKKEWSCKKVVRIPFACTVEDGLAPAGILGTAYMPRKCPWIEMSRSSLPLYCTQLVLVKPQVPAGYNAQQIAQEWDVEYHFCVELKRIKF